MAEPTTPQHQRVTSLQLDSNVGRTPSQPTSHYSSSTRISDAKANLKTILATRISYNDPNIVDILIKPNKVDNEFVQTLMGCITTDPVITRFLDAVRDQTVSLENQMYKPLVRGARYPYCSHSYLEQQQLLNSITDYCEDDATDDGVTDAPAKESEDGKGDDLMPKTESDANFARRINRLWLDVHSLIPRTDKGLFIPGMPTEYEVEEEFVIGNKHSRSMRNEDVGDEDDEDEDPRPTKSSRTSRAQQHVRGGNNKGKTAGFEKRRPDLVLVDLATEPRQDWCLWRHFAVLLEVKRNRSDGPNPAHGTALTGLAAQLADMARLHLAARPFMRYSVHLSICGAIFNLAIFDRAGGVISKNYNLNTDLELFVRVICRLGRELDAYDLGLDPTVVPLHCLGNWERFPEFRVTVGGSTYTTRGLPLWQSTSLVGRGTFVWVVELEAGAEESGKGKTKSFILKNAWRASARLAESTIYKMIWSAPEELTSHLTDLDGVARFVEGGDVFDPQQPNGMIKVSSHRKGFGNPVNEADDPVLHRLVLASHGRKLYEFANFSELMRGAKKMNSGQSNIFVERSLLIILQDFGPFMNVESFMGTSASVTSSLVGQRRLPALLVISIWLRLTWKLSRNYSPNRMMRSH